MPGIEQWTDTGVDLSINDTVLIEADGAVTPTENREPVFGPDGVSDRPSARVFNLDGLEEETHNGLIGRLGEVWAPFQVGSQLQYIADTEGRLFLGSMTPTSRTMLVSSPPPSPGTGRNRPRAEIQGRRCPAR